MKKLSEPTAKQIYLWNIAGTVLNAMLTVLLLMFVFAFLSDEDGDTFSIAWSFGMQAVTIGIFQIRLYQATDTLEKYSFRQYAIVRVITVAAMMLYSAVYVIYMEYSAYKAWVVILVCLSRAVDAFSDLYQGWYQQKQRLDLAGKALAAHAVASVIAFALGLYCFRELLVSCALMLAGHLVVFALFDYRYFRYMRQSFSIDGALQRTGGKGSFVASMLAACLPLFLNAYIIMDVFNKPKFAIDAAISRGIFPDGSQKIYNILFLAASVLNLAFFMFRPLVTELALKWNAGDRAGFFGIIRRIGMILTVFVVVLYAGGWFLGCPVLSLLYSTDLSRYRGVLMIVITGGIFNTFMYLMDNAVTVIRRQSLLLIPYLITWAYTQLTAESFVLGYGLLGAAVSFASSMLLLLVCTTVIFFLSLRTVKKA